MPLPKLAEAQRNNQGEQLSSVKRDGRRPEIWKATEAREQRLRRTTGNQETAAPSAKATRDVAGADADPKEGTGSQGTQALQAMLKKTAGSQDAAAPGERRTTGNQETAAPSAKATRDVAGADADPKEGTGSQGTQALQAMLKKTTGSQDAAAPGERRTTGNQETAAPSAKATRDVAGANAEQQEGTKDEEGAKRHTTQVEKMKAAGLVGRIVKHPGFDLFFAAVVITNAIFIGVDVQQATSAYGQEATAAYSRPAIYMIVGYFYTALYIAELVLRLSAYGLRLFCSEDWMWVLLDCFIVTTSIWDVFVDVLTAILPPDQNGFESVSGLSTLKAFRVIRVTRVLKIAQLLRIFRFVMALRTLVQSIFHTLKALVWALLLLALIVYVFAVIFTQAVSDYRLEMDADGRTLPLLVSNEGLLYFGSLDGSMLSLFMSIAGGLSWEAAFRPLSSVSWYWGWAFIFYVSFTYFAVLNVVTAVFCQSAIESAQKDHATVVQNMLDNKESHLQKLRTLFSKLGAEEAGGITFGMFEQKINSGPVREYFETLGLDVWDPWSFFKLLDSDGGGFVEIEEFFLGCLRFSGAAKAMDVGKLIQDQTWLIRSQGRFQRYMEDELVNFRDDLATLRDFISSVSRGVSCAQL
ncbi:unnamed protein product [Symbiodinium natans]|uniref:Ion transport domain-containing protein n=1 Tax=Symbiodinium natans TaxID=878477 RepID=A0A812M8T1_9DINO|nr:unnamed protein product [Symbiodinium natans]